MEYEQEVFEEEVKVEKKVRRRTNNLYKIIKQQMEFYFSDSNLLRDKFLQKTIQNNKDGYVDVNIFLTFNKIRALTKKSRDIINAVSSSDLLEVNEDRTKLRRKLPVKYRENIDDCTVYVERLPIEVDHDWLKAVFNNFGTVLYVSLPRFKHTGKHKGFAFVEFDTPESADKACQYFANNTEDDTAQEDIYEEEISTQCEDNQLQLLEEEPHLKKRERDDDDDDDTEQENKAKRQKMLTDDSLVDQNTNENVINIEESTALKKHKKKKHRKRDKHKKKVKTEVETEEIILRVMPKREWKSWKNKYLSLQKKVMTQVKQTLLLDNHSTDKVTNNTKELDDKQNNKNMIEYQPGVIIKMETEEPISRISEFKERIRQLGDVSYVDVSKEQTTAYIRCPNSTSATKILENNSQSNIGQMILLTGTEEAAYWEKIKNDKSKKHSKNNKFRHQNKRGRNKIITKVENVIKNTHIRFDN